MRLWPAPVERAEPDAAGPDRNGAWLSPDFLTETFRNPLDPGYAEAAARRGDRPPPSGVRVATVAVLVVIGFLLALAYRQVLAEEPTRARLRGELVDQIHEVEAQTDALQQRADEVGAEVARLRDAELDAGQAARLRDLEATTGLAEVRGDGLVIRVADGPASVDPITGAQVIDPNARIRDRDLRLIANELWAAGAEAVAINGQRLTATATIRNAGVAVLVDFRPVTGPYEVSAIGPDAMAQRFEASTTGTLMRLLASEYGIAYGSRSEPDLVLPAAGVPQLRFAEPVGVPASPGGD